MRPHPIGSQQRKHTTFHLTAALGVNTQLVKWVNSHLLVVELQGVVSLGCFRNPGMTSVDGVISVTTPMVFH